MPNPNHDPETGQFTNPPTPEPAAGPDWSSFEQAGITPDNAHEVQQALNLYRGVNNLDTRQQYLDQLIRPGLDPWSKAQAEQQDPWSAMQGDDEGEYEYEQPQAPAFDPRQLTPVFEGYAERIERGIFEKLGAMAQRQALEDAATQALTKHGLPADLAPGLQQEVEQITRQYSNRQPGEVAEQLAAQKKQKLMEWANANVGRPSQQGAPPPAGAPTPSGDGPPRTDEEAMRRSMEMLDPSP